MFHGSIPQDVRNMAHEVTQAWSCADVYVACSGNFTMERVLSTLNRFRLHGNDIQIYSCALGAYLASQPIPITYSPELLAHMPFLAGTIATPADQLATLLLLSRYPQLLSDRKVSGNRYYQRLFTGMAQQWSDLHAKTLTRLEPLPLHLATFSAADAADWITQVPPDAGFCSYPPFFGADKAFQRDFAMLDSVADWPRPSFQPLTPERLNRFMQIATDREHWMIGTNQYLEQYADHLCGRAQTTNRGVPIYLYASRATTRIVTPRQKTVPVAAPRLVTGEAIGSTMRLHLLSTQQFQSLRSQYMNPFIRPGAETQAFGVTVDHRLIGVFAISTSPGPAAYSDLSSIYLLSDFPVAPTDYPRLSKLVLYAALSSEAQLLYERVARHRIRRISTTAFSNNPVSMKYRGIFTLKSRKELAHDQSWSKDSDTHDPYYAQKYQLQYVASIGTWSLAEGLALWQKKHGQRNTIGASDD